MMIFGAAFHVLPRFAGRALWRVYLAHGQFIMAQVGVLGMCLSFAWAPLRLWLPLFATIMWISTVMFVLNMGMTLRLAPALTPLVKPDNVSSRS